MARWVLGIVTLFWGLPVVAQGELEVVFLDVGLGDATLIIAPSGATVLVDSGNNGMGFATVLPLLDGLGIDTLDYFIASHYHADHIGGIDEVIAGGVQVTVSYDRGGDYDTNTYDDYVAAVGAARTTIAVGEVIDLGDGITLSCVAVNGMVLGGAMVPVAGTNQEESARCVALVLRHDQFDLFLGGDLTGGGFSTADVEKPVGPQVGDVEVLRVNHHGSNTSSRGAFLGALKPNVAIISLGDGNPFGYPHTETLERLSTLPMLEVIYQTETGTGSTTPEVVVADGPITLLSGGTDYTILADGVPPQTFPVNVNPGHIVINEIMKNPSAVGDSVGEWFELYNLGPTAIDLDGWVLLDDDFDFHVIDEPGGLVVGPGEFLVLGVEGNPAFNGGYDPDYVYADFLLGNAGDEVVIGPAAGGDILELDRVEYSDASFPDTPGVSMELIDLTGDNADGMLWANSLTPFGDGDLGTPGENNSTAPPLDALFIRGDANGDGVIGLADPVATLGYLFAGAPIPSCLDAHDLNDSGTVALDDAIYSLAFQFQSGDPPPAPYPAPGTDPTSDPLGCD